MAQPTWLFERKIARGEVRIGITGTRFHAELNGRLLKLANNDVIKLADLAASFQQAAVDSILAKLALALDRTGCRVMAIGGGVTANTLLRESVERLGRDRGIDVLIPPRSLCTDNAAMGAIAWERLERGENDGLELDVLPGTDRSAARRKMA